MNQERIEAVKKILSEIHQMGQEWRPVFYARDDWFTEKAKEICQLFEPQPDESRLLTDQERREALQSWEQLISEDILAEALRSWVNVLLEKQRDVTARIEDAECQKRVNIFVHGLANIAGNFGRGSFSGDPCFKVEGRFRIAASKTLHEAGYNYYEYPAVPPDKDGWYTETEWQALKKQEGIS